MLLHQSNQGSLQRLSRRDGSGSCSETLTLIWDNHLQTLLLNRWEGSDWFSACRVVVGRNLLPGLGKLKLESVVLSCWVQCSSDLGNFWDEEDECSSCCPSEVGLASEIVSSGLKDCAPVEVVHISSENSWFC